MGGRLILGMMAAGVVLALTAPAAQAKGPHSGMPVQATASVNGPKMKIPIVFGWQGQCGILDQCSDLKDLENDTLTLARDLGLSGNIPSYAKSFYVPPPMSKMGPAYTVRWVIRQGPSVWNITQRLYPYAPGRPWVFTPAGQTMLGVSLDGQGLPGGWMSAPPSVNGFLQGFGLPAAPKVSAAVAATSVQVAASHAWVWVAAAGALALLVVAGAVAGRRRTVVGAV